MKKPIIIGIMILLILSTVHAQTSEKQTDPLGWIWNSITQIWEYWLGGNILQTANEPIAAKELFSEVYLNQEKQILGKSISNFGNTIIITDNII